MKFADYSYERPNYLEVKSNMTFLFKALAKSQKLDEQLGIIEKINSMRNNIDTMLNISQIRNSIDTEDEFYDLEASYWDEHSPFYQELDSEFYSTILTLKNIDEIKKVLGEHFFKFIEFTLKSFSKDIIEDLQEENKESTKHMKLLASAKILFDGKERNLSGMTPFITSKDRMIRQRAQEAKYSFYLQNEDKLDEIFDNLVKIRDKIAKKLGYNNFVELGYIRMKRLDYNPEMVKNFRTQVVEQLVPLATSLYERQKKRLGLDALKYYDEKYEFESGNPTPKGDSQWIINEGQKMYHEMSPETKEFIDFMINKELMDLTTKKGKAGGGYCTFIPDYSSPFIFSNFNGTSGDIDVLTHEAGHAFQVFRTFNSRTEKKLPELLWPTYESAEIHSMSMEFFAWDWMKNFFKEDTEKYFYSHLGGAIKFIPYGVLVDEFQHFVYETPSATPKERKLMWRELEKKYLPHKDYKENPLLERGGWWFQQSHIFQMPFYYIDYTLAQICALQFWKKMRENKKEAWSDYLHLCNLGGTKSFLELLKEANLKSPFDNNTVAEVVKPISEYLSSVDDMKL
ncbi:MAG: M3 family oligoendopeptidase [Fusobacteriaceae bacterium]